MTTLSPPAQTTRSGLFYGLTAPRLKILVCRQNASLKRYPDRLIVLKVRNVIALKRTPYRYRVRAMLARL